MNLTFFEQTEKNEEPIKEALPKTKSVSPEPPVIKALPRNEEKALQFFRDNELEHKTIAPPKTPKEKRKKGSVVGGTLLKRSVAVVVVLCIGVLWFQSYQAEQLQKEKELEQSRKEVALQQQAASQAAASKEAERQEEAAAQARYEQAGTWQLLLADVEKPLESDPAAELVTPEGSDQQIDSRMQPDLDALMAAANAAGFEFTLTVGYRSYEKQEEMYERYVREQERNGYTGEDAKQRAAQLCSAPGTSDHQTALGIHLIQKGCEEMSASQYEQTDAYAWLTANCASYGFVLRYPADKTDKTGAAFEPWHFRYVGTENAQQMQINGYCLEEYIDFLLA